MIRLSEKDHCLIVDSDPNDLAPRHESQLAYWGFAFEENGRRYSAKVNDLIELAAKVTDYLERCDLLVELEPPLIDRLNKRSQTFDQLSKSRARGSS